MERLKKLVEAARIKIGDYVVFYEKSANSLIEKYGRVKEVDFPKVIVAKHPVGTVELNLYNDSVEVISKQQFMQNTNMRGV